MTTLSSAGTSGTGKTQDLSRAPGKTDTIPTLTLTVPAADGTVATISGSPLASVIFWSDGQLQTYISKHTQIVPNSLPIFITYNSYLTEFGGCCIGGYHSAFGSSAAPQTYAHFTYISTPGIFAQDVSALSHEAAEWIDDPLSSTRTETRSLADS